MVTDRAAALLARLGAAIGAEHAGLANGTIAVRPGSGAELAALHKLAGDAFLAPGGRGDPVGNGDAGATIRVGGARAARSPSGRLRIRVDLGRMASVLELDETSLLCHVQAGLGIAALEGELRARGLTLGPLPPATLQRTVGAVLAAPRATEATPRGRLIDRCGAVDAVLADATALSTRLAPRKATGPDLAQVLIGAHGTTGAITGAWLRVDRRAPRTEGVGLVFPSGSDALAVARRLLARGGRPADLALVDGALAPALADAAAGAPALAVEKAGSPVLLLALLDGTPELVAAEETLLRAIVDALPAEAAPGAIAAPVVETWFASREAVELAEEFVPAPSLEAAWNGRLSPALLSGFHAAGAALCTRPSPATTPPREPGPSERLRQALRRRLDGENLFGA